MYDKGLDRPIVGLALMLVFVVACSAPLTTPTAPTPTRTPPVLLTEEVVSATPLHPAVTEEGTAVTTPTVAATAVPFPTAVKPDWVSVPYLPEGSLLQRLDVYLPADGAGPFPTILAIHGGGFRARSKLLYNRLAGHLNESGYAIVSTDYRLAPRYSYPAQVEDVFCALAWIHANHETYGFDSERIFVMGDSAGGYLAAMLGTVETTGLYLENCPHTLPASDWIQGVVVFYGFYDFTSIDGYPKSNLPSLQWYWGAEFSEISPETLAEMSPMSWVDGSEPPFLLIHGKLDPVVPSWMSEDFAEALEEAGVAVELVRPEAKHAFLLQPLSSPANVQSLEAIEAFLAGLTDK